jgi:hypothetical protein
MYVAKGRLSPNRCGDESHRDWLVTEDLSTKSMNLNPKVSGDAHFLINKIDSAVRCCQSNCCGARQPLTDVDSVEMALHQAVQGAISDTRVGIPRGVSPISQIQANP